MKNVINRTFELNQVTYPEQSYFAGAFGDNLTLKFTTDRICQLSSKNPDRTNKIFLTGQWEDKIDQGGKVFILNINGAPVKFYYELLESNEKLHFELELEGNQYIFIEK